MSVFDLQGMETPLSTAGGGSSNSGHSCPSGLSVAACGGPSGLSVTICH
ncbi:SapB/AmfS family lanthipeptide [Amycolatopsis sp. EV170708-02-1]|nr:SapB/AmfS family lanthipeptide [Amycolatopsis sp. EV170708-02-1]UMP06773.1 SapB/AmfS family lanthipeptide [Amycolatopsis sp. EV170708-02-1]